MTRREHVRVRVISRALCLDRGGCRSCLTTYNDGVKHEAECDKKDCDNHLQVDEAERQPMPLQPPAWFVEALESA